MQNRLAYTHIILRAQKLIEEGVVILDARNKNLKILYINAGIKKITGLNSKDLIGKSTGIFINNNSSRENIDKFNNSLTNRKNSVCDLYISHKSKEPRYCRVSVSYIAEKAKSGYYLLLIRDITEIRIKMMNDEKLKIVNTTLRSVNDIIFNFMNGLMLFRTDCEENCSSAKVNLKSFDREYETTLKKLKRINELKEYKERKINKEMPFLTVLMI